MDTTSVSDADLERTFGGLFMGFMLSATLYGTSIFRYVVGLALTPSTRLDAIPNIFVLHEIQKRPTMAAVFGK